MEDNKEQHNNNKKYTKIGKGPRYLALVDPKLLIPNDSVLLELGWAKARR